MVTDFEEATLFTIENELSDHNGIFTFLPLDDFQATSSEERFTYRNKTDFVRLNQILRPRLHSLLQASVDSNPTDMMQSFTTFEQAYGVYEADEV